MGDPPGGLPESAWDIPSDNGGDQDSDEDCDDDDDHDDSRASGRLSEVNIEILKNGFKTVQQIAQDVAAKTGLSPAQVFDHWTSANTRKHVKWNMWNLYGAYFKDHEKQELARLTSCRSLSSFNVIVRLTTVSTSDP